MRNDTHVTVVIPARNEARSIGRVIDAIPPWVDDIVVCDNDSTDWTAHVAGEHGARVVFERHHGYGAACQAALAALRRTDVVVFLDADFSDFPEEMDALVDPILRDEAELVIGSRVRGRRERGALTPQARFGNWLACRLLRWIWGVSFTDLGPFRAIRFTSLRRLGMRDRDYGWTAEMQVKAVRFRLRVTEVPVRYRVRIGKSKVSGTLRGVIGAGFKILYTVLRSAIWRMRTGPQSPSRRHLIVFTRYPRPGFAKTRLIPALGARGAAGLSRRLTVQTLEWARRLRSDDPISVEIRFTGGSKRRMRRTFGDDLRLVSQGRGDLGDRLARATRDAFARGAERVVVVGTDCPGLNERIVREAFWRLADRPLVIGPAGDGGYYLIGLSGPYPSLFRGIHWGSNTVLRETLARAHEAGLSGTTLVTLRDVDEPEDVALCDAAPAHPPPNKRGGTGKVFT